MENDLKVHEAAALLRVCTKTVRNYIKSGQLPAIRTPTGRLWIRRADLELFRYGATARE